MKKATKLLICSVLILGLILPFIGLSYAASSFTTVSQFNSKKYTHYGVFASTTVKDMIDVSEHNGLINFEKIKSLGIDDVIIRVGFRGYGSSGSLGEDKYFYDNMENAIDAGLHIGLYFYSQSLNTDEAVAEANFCIKRAAQYKQYITLPIFFDYEFAEVSTGRLDSAWNSGKLNKTKMTQNAVAFCETIRSAGYLAGVYASSGFYTYQLDGATFHKKGYDIWNAYYTSNSTAGSYWTNKNPVYRYWQYGGANVQGSCGNPDTAWLKVKYGSNTGYVLAANVDFVGATTAVSITDINLRKGAGLSYSVITKIPFAGKMTILSYPTTTQTDINFYYSTENLTPEKPNFTLSAKTNSITLSWKWVSGASYYKVFSYDKQAQKYTKLAQVNTTSYTHASLAANEEHSYLVRAYSAQGKGSAYKVEDVKSITTAPELPAFSLKATSDTVTVSWKSVKGAAYYRVYAYDSTKKSYTRLTQSEALSYTQSGLTKLQTYTYLVRAFNEAGAGSTHTEKNNQSIVTAPAKPAFTLKAGTDTVYISWKAVENAAYYRVYSFDSAAAKHTRLTQTTATSFAVNGLKSTQNYTYLVRAFFADGTGSPYTFNDNKSILTAPVPTTAQCTGRTSDSLTLSWQASANAAYYRVYAFDNEAGTYRKLLQTDATQGTVKDLEGGTVYTLLVRAYNKNGAGSDYSAKDHFEATTLPAAPTVTLKAYSDSIKISWKAVKNAAHYRVYAYNAGTKKYTTLAQTDALSYTAEGLNANTQYTYLVRAFEGESGGSSYTVANTVSTKTLLAKPVFKISAAGESALKISWAKVSGASYYRVFLYDSGTNTYKRLTQTTALSYTYNKAPLGAKYTFLVRAFNASDVGSSYTEQDRKSFEHALKQVNFSLSAAEKGKVQLNWSAVKYAANYRIYSYDRSTGKFTKLAQTKNLTYTVGSLKSGTQISLLVRAFAASGAGSPYTKADVQSIVVK